ncbi:MAG: GPP34 family phosphoprotein [Anaerovoracaceae bacterium]
MDRRMLAQEYLILISDERGNLPAMYIESAKGGLIVASLMDMLLCDAIKMEKKKIAVSGLLSDDAEPAASLYEYISEKTPGTFKVSVDYLLSANKRFNRLMEDIGESLIKQGNAKKAKGGFLGNKDVYIPEPVYKENLVNFLKEAVASEDLSSHDTYLFLLLKETRMLHRYFTSEESAEIKRKLIGIKQKPNNRQLMEIMDFVDNIIFLVLCLIVFGAVLV